MDNELLNIKYELPKSPALTPTSDVEHFYYKDDDGRFMECYATCLSNNAQADIPNSLQMSYQNTFPHGTNLGPTVIATPPQSPLHMTMQHNQQQLPQQPRPQDMPLLTAMLANNNPAVSYAPPNYIVNIPCYLCQEPFSTIETLRDHLTLHALQFQMYNPLNPTAIAPTAAVERQGMQPIGAAPWESLGTHPAYNYPMQPIGNHMHQLPLEPMSFICELCGRSYPMEWQRNNCLAQHSAPKVQRKRNGTSVYKCHLCKKSYKRPSNLLKHSRLMHIQTEVRKAISPANTRMAPPSTQAIPSIPATVAANTALAKAPFPAPIQATAADPSDSDSKARCVWTTKLINAVAAANYSPAKESASKYMPPSEQNREEWDSGQQIKPKQKYPLRSPYFNPNLWVDNDAYIE